MDGRTDVALYLCRLYQRCRRDAQKKNKKLIDKKKKKVPDPYMYQNLEAILLFFDLSSMLIVIKRKNNEKSVDLCY